MTAPPHEQYRFACLSGQIRSKGAISRFARKEAFSLIEILITIAIIVLIMAIFLPAFQKVRQAADNLGCISNLRQIGLGIQNYCSDHDNFLPGPTSSGQRSTYYKKNPYSISLVETMATYWGSPAMTSTPQVCKILICPAYKKVIPAQQWPDGFAYISAFKLLDPKGKTVRDEAGNTINPWGHPGSGSNDDPLRISTLASLVNLATTWAIQDADAVSYTADDSRIVGLAPSPVHKNHWNRLYFDWHVGAVTEQ